MKHFFDAILVTVLAVSLVGCGKKEEPKPEPPAKVGDAKAEEAVKSATDAGAKAVEETKAKVEETGAKVEAAAAGVQTQVADATGRFDAIVAGIKANMANNSFDKALAGVKEGLGLQGLTGEQKGILERLQEMIVQALAKKGTADAAKAVEGAAGDAVKKLGGLPKLGVK